MTAPTGQPARDAAPTADPASLTAAVKREAVRLGFVACGVVPAAPTVSHRFYEAWLAAGYAGAMGYLHRHSALKSDPRALLPEARFVIVLAHPDGGAAETLPADEGGIRGRVSRYALGPDYHDVLRDKLERLAQFLAHRMRRPLRHRACVDSAPLMERELAARAGLGWVGRNGMLITWRHGSWVMLGELLVDAELVPDVPPSPRSGYVRPPRQERPPPLPAGAQVRPGALRPPLQDGCGSCTACLEVCPTGAIVGDRTVDARRCLSYLTIELKGPIPRSLRPGLEDWVFGCDLCQAVCPWNRPEPAASRHDDAATPKLASLLALDETAFRERFRATALWRPRRRGVLRNVAVVLGNRLAGRPGTRPKPVGTRAAEAVRSLGRALHDVEPLVRGAAAWSLGQAPAGEPAHDLLREALATEPDSVVRGEIAAALHGPDSA